MVSFFLYFLLALLAPVEVDTTDCYQVPEKYGDAWISDYTSDGLCHFNDKELIPVFPFGSVEFDWK